jgi:hypothetical protein
VLANRLSEEERPMAEIKFGPASAREYLDQHGSTALPAASGRRNPRELDELGQRALEHCRVAVV